MGPQEQVARTRETKNDGCMCCRHNHSFTMPAELFEGFKTGRVVVFARAGVSTETPLVFPYTFYDEIRSELNLEERDQPLFSQVMSRFCKQPNGRRLLLQKLKSRFDYIKSFEELLRSASRFHSELATIPHLDEIVTTNWDDYFERFCQATPIVTAEDFVFWDTPGRKVYKIHGSINNYGSLVVTAEDYKTCYSTLSRGLIGSNLKMLLATKPVLFVGYSFRDEDFSRIYSLVKREMKGLIPHAYIVTISKEDEPRFREMGFTPIVTDATYFIQVVKAHLESEGRLLPESRFGSICVELVNMNEAHRKLHSSFKYRTSPELLYCASYQDGVIHALERIITKAPSGEYSCPNRVRNLVASYENSRKMKVSRRRYADVAYIDGYIMGLLYLMADDSLRKEFPRYYVYGSEQYLGTMREYRKVSQHARKLHRAAYDFAVKLAAKIPNDTVYHHSPFLL